jgi:hypothetical protein
MSLSLGIVPMKPLHLTIGAVAVAAAAVALGAWAPALAQKGGKGAKVPDSWAYELKNGKRVPKANRIVASDGSWKEEAKDGPCVMVREQTGPGEYREVRKCD